MSRWERWTTQPKQGMSLSGFIAEQQSPAEMAQSMGLQSDGSGGYVDESGNVVARTVNNELVFYDPMGGAISAQSDGAALTQAQPSWRDPVTGEITVPPGQAESPEEIAAIPDIVPAQAPASYNAFMNKKKKEMYANQAPPEQEAVDDIQQEADPEMGMQPEMGQGMAMGMESKTFSDYMSEEPEQNNEPNNQPEQPQRLNLRDYRLARRPKGKGLAAQRKQSAYDQRFPERQPQSPQQNISESEQKAESARRSSFQHRIESTIPANDNTSQQESNSIAAIMHGLKNPVSSLDENEDLFQMTQANQPDLADPKKGKEWFDAYVQQARRVREILNMKDDDSDDDWMVERTQNRNRLNFVDSKDQHDLMQHIWDIMGDDVRKNRYGSQMDTFNPADMSLVRRSQYEQIRGAIDKIAKEFGGNSDILPEIINTYLHS